MSLDTHGRLQGKVLPEQILNFIKQKYDKSATMDIKKEKFNMADYIKEIYGDKSDLYYKSGFISFKYNDEIRQLFYDYQNYNTYENLKYYSEIGLENLVKSETTYLSLGHWGSSVEIMKDIVSEFGGWIDEDDCDDYPYYPVIKNPDGSIKPVKYVSIQDIYDKFEAVVVITK